MTIRTLRDLWMSGVVNDQARVNIVGFSFYDLKALFECSVCDHEFFDVIGQEIAFKNPRYLLEGLDRFLGARKRGAIFGLSFLSGADAEEAIDKLLLILNGDATDSILAATIDALGDLSGKSVFNEVMQHRNHESPYVRGAVLRLVYGSQVERAEEILADYMQDPHPIVRQGVADGLEELATPRAIELLEFIAKSDQDEVVRQVAIDALETLAE